MMRKLCCLLLALCLCAGFACAEGEKAALAVAFDEGFSLSLPEGWVSYPIQDPVIRYALGDGSGEHFLYILGEPAAFRDFDEMQSALDAREDLDRTSPLDLNGQPFAAFILPGQNASGCATLMNGEVITFLFTPQDDSEYMLAVARIMSSFRIGG